MTEGIREIRKNVYDDITLNTIIIFSIIATNGIFKTDVRWSLVIY